MLLNILGFVQGLKWACSQSHAFITTLSIYQKFNNVQHYSWNQHVQIWYLPNLCRDENWKLVTSWRLFLELIGCMVFSRCYLHFMEIDLYCISIIQNQMERRKLSPFFLLLLEQSCDPSPFSLHQPFQNLKIDFFFKFLWLYCWWT